MSAPTMVAIGVMRFILGDVDEELVEVEDAEAGWLPVVVEAAAVEATAVEATAVEVVAVEVVVFDIAV